MYDTEIWTFSDTGISFFGREIFTKTE